MRLNRGMVAVAALLSLVATRASALDDSYLKSFQQAALVGHNTFRAKHGVPALKPSEKIRAVAQAYAESLAARDVFEHSKGSGYGENLYMSWSSTGIPPDPASLGQQSLSSWYNEIKDYDWNKATFSMATGHFTQVVWKSSTEVGCGVAQSASKKVYVVCNYSPPGNMMGAFKENVLKPR